MLSLSTITIREGTTADISEIARQRRRMCEDMNYTDADILSAMVNATCDYLKKAIPEGSFRSWLACDNSRVVAGGAVLISAWPAHAYDLECRRATILNVYTEPEYRRLGIARQIMETMIDWCKKEGFARVSLHASNQGRHLYESLGFEDSNEMRLNLR
ncbi:MAG TPA: GNAT family N-acetyltransferase [Candidatus Sulfotelmatobacter sp.]|nr:GNAT family N-acetyltransferase [Candidatus Sulfotelmatobacter sp.]